MLAHSVNMYGGEMLAQEPKRRRTALIPRLDGFMKNESEVNPAELVFGTRSLEGALTGSPIDAEEALAFSLLAGVRPRIETMPLEAAAEAYGKMMRGEARFRMVLVMGR